MILAIIKKEGEISKCPRNLTVLKKVEKIYNDVNRQLIKDYYPT
jgi:hypothetical protein